MSRTIVQVKGIKKMQITDYFLINLKDHLESNSIGEKKRLTERARGYIN